MKEKNKYIKTNYFNSHINTPINIGCNSTVYK